MRNLYWQSRLFLIRYNVPKPVLPTHPDVLDALEGRAEKARGLPAARLLQKGCTSLAALLSKMTIEDRVASTDV